MVQHCVHHFDEPGDVGADHVIARFSEIDGHVTAGLVNLFHNRFEPVVHLLPGPVQPHAVLGHFKTGYGYPAGIGGFARAVEDFMVEEDIDGLIAEDMPVN